MKRLVLGLGLVLTLVHAGVDLGLKGHRFAQPLRSREC